VPPVTSTRRPAILERCIPEAYADSAAHRNDTVRRDTARRYYDAPMSVLNRHARRLIESATLAHLVTLNADGSPQVTCVWAGIEDDEIVIGHLSQHRKVRNVERDNRVAVSFEAPGHTAYGLREYLVVYGTARITEGGAAALLQRLAHTHFDDQRRFPDSDTPPAGYITRIRPDRVAGAGPWTGNDAA
jgi:PPOX class probable F420-dependent enzyme